jgi:hypothetical protein
MNSRRRIACSETNSGNGTGKEGRGERGLNVRFEVIRVDSRVPVDARLAGIFGQAPRPSQAVVNPLEGVRLRNLGSIGPAAVHAGRKEVRQIPFRLSQATTKPGIPASLKLFAKPIISSRD